MNKHSIGLSSLRRAGANAALGLAALVAGCGAGDGVEDRGATETYLAVDASDADGDTLQYEWRVTGGVVHNRNAKEVVWSMPDGPGVHFAYVVVSDGKGGYSEQQYAVATDALETGAAARAAVSHVAPAVAEFAGGTTLLSATAGNATDFSPPSGGVRLARSVYLPDMQVQVLDPALSTVASGMTDWRGHLSLPKLAPGEYALRCVPAQGAVGRDCGALSVGTASARSTLSPVIPATQNLRLFGHVALADGGVCGVRNAFAGLESAATVQLIQKADNAVLTNAVRVNAYGDYALDAAVAVHADLKLRVRCEDIELTPDVPADADPAGYNSLRPIELSQVLPNSRPRIRRVLANGPDGNVRGEMVLPEQGAPSNSLPGADHFLTFKGQDTPLSGCMYYRSIGAVGGCDSQGVATNPISFDDWKRARKFKPYDAGNTEATATYINSVDLNLVRRMVATQSGPQDIAFYVCNHPGPEGRSQLEVDRVVDTALAGEKLAACVAMEWSATPGVNGDQPFTKFFTFAPDGSLVASVNLDGRGEKYMPGACVACHGGNQYIGRFPDTGDPSPNLGATFLPFDTGNYLFSTQLGFSEAAQGAAFYQLNQLVNGTEPTAATSSLIDGWYQAGGTTLDKNYVPSFWVNKEITEPGAATFYREVIARSCRTCHVAMSGFDWDSAAPLVGSAHICGGTSNLEQNASMANALIAYDHLQQRVQTDPALAALVQTFLGCTGPSADPVYPRR